MLRVFCIKLFRQRVKCYTQRGMKHAETQPTIHNRAFRLNNLRCQRVFAAPNKLRPNRCPSSRPRLKRAIRQRLRCNLRRRSRRTLNSTGQPRAWAVHVYFLVPLRSLNRRFPSPLPNQRNLRRRQPQQTHSCHGSGNHDDWVNQLFGVRSFPTVRSFGKGVFKRRLIHPEKHNARHAGSVYGSSHRDCGGLRCGLSLEQVPASHSRLKAHLFDFFVNQLCNHQIGDKHAFDAQQFCQLSRFLVLRY